LDQDTFVTLLGKLIGEAEKLQNNPPDLIPQEDLAVQHVLEVLKPYTTEQGGPLKVETPCYTKGRSNVLITYPGTGDKCLSFVGSHLDVVPANPETWERPPFEMIREDDKLYGRGTTDCLGHVALVTCFFKALAEKRPELPITINGVFIASEEAEGPGVGIDGLLKDGKLEHLRNGPIIWIDCADSQPCIGTAGALPWHLEVEGLLFHSGLPHKGINALEFAMEATAELQKRFYEQFPAHPSETDYNFATPSTMKPTQISVPKGGLNQLPPTCKVSGDIRLTPFYDVKEVQEAVKGYVDDINANLSSLATRGPCSKYEVPNKKGSLNFYFGAHCLSGIACDRSSPAFTALCKAMEEVNGSAVPYSICGSLPLVGDLQAEGFDIQLTGFGKSEVYHANNEYCSLNDMINACKILARTVELVMDN